MHMKNHVIWWHCMIAGRLMDFISPMEPLQLSLEIMLAGAINGICSEKPGGVGRQVTGKNMANDIKSISTTKDEVILMPVNASGKPIEDDVQTIEGVSILSSSEDNSALDFSPIEAVKVSDAYKTYGKSIPVLRGLNMTVKQGAIYSLLGSSGCGKTTLLTCIIGIRHIDAGSIYVFGSPPTPGAHIGYMPQDYALYPDLTLRETLDFYGHVYGIHEGGKKGRNKLKKRINFLIDFLLFSKGADRRKISQLSGGQKRRVSLAIAMLHEPKLLILDEPTVGVDQLLREKIWDLLKELVTVNNTTVIITTHYIEEARASETIGFMRSGRLLCEESPNTLLEKYGTTLLEDVVLEMTREDEDQNKIEGEGGDALEPKQNKVDKEHVKRPLLGRRRGSTDNKPFKISRFNALLKKNIFHLLRNMTFLAFNFLIPSIQIIVACLTMGIDPHDLKWGVVNYEVPLNGCESITPNLTCSPPANFSCIYSSEIANYSHSYGKALDIKFFETEKEAESNVMSGNVWGYVVFPKNFSTALTHRFNSGVNVDDDVLNASKITLRMDHSSEPINNLMSKIFLESYASFVKRILKLCNINEKVVDPPVVFDEGIYGSKDSNLRDFFAPGLVISNLFFTPFAASGITFILEKKEGTLERSFVAGITTLEILGATTVAQLIVLIVQTILTLLTITLLFDVAVVGSIWLVGALGVLTGLAGMSIGFLISSVVEEEVQAMIIAMGSFSPNFALAGIVWPREAMPNVLQYISYLFPCSLASEAMRSIMTRGVGMAHRKVWLGFVSTFGWIVFYYGLTVVIHAIAARRR